MRFADTSFWVALQVPRDAHHDEARRVWSRNPGVVLVTNHVLGEGWTYLRRRAGHNAAVRFLEALQNSNRVQQLHVDQQVEKEAWLWLKRRGEREYSFVDATSFIVMRKKKLREALAFDGDFSAAGFVEVRA